jgi:hypothetical protein
VAPGLVLPVPVEPVVEPVDVPPEVDPEVELPAVELPEVELPEVELPEVFTEPELGEDVPDDLDVPCEPDLDVSFLASNKGLL